MSYGVVYCRVFPNGKCYIGQSIEMEKRILRENKDAQNKSDLLLYRALRKYNFETEDFILAYGVDKADLNFLEKQYIKLYNSIENGYNMTEGGEGGSPSKEVRMRISNTLKGQKQSKKTREKRRKTLKKLYENSEQRLKCGTRKENHHMWEKNHPTDTKNKIAKTNSIVMRKNKFGFHGACFLKSFKNHDGTKCWKASIKYKSKDKYLGNFHDPLSCEIIYDFVWEEIYDK